MGIEQLLAIQAQQVNRGRTTVSPVIRRKPSQDAMARMLATQISVKRNELPVARALPPAGQESNREAVARMLAHQTAVGKAAGRQFNEGVFNDEFDQFMTALESGDADALKAFGIDLGPMNFSGSAHGTAQVSYGATETTPTAETPAEPEPIAETPVEPEPTAETPAEPEAAPVEEAPKPTKRKSCSKAAATAQETLTNPIAGLAESVE